ncbi:MAG: methyltransferase domain-containing protein, partial [Pseudomonadota bacterium]|nr:methyltransferase domain-containing protein [Pseudomonadota bacterium]
MKKQPPPCGQGTDLSTKKMIDFSSVDLNYEKFRELARNPHLTPEEKIAFPVSYRQGYEDSIVRDITAKLGLESRTGQTVIDIGCGVGGVTDRLIEICRKQKHRLVLVDSGEMLALLPDHPFISKIAGMYPSNAEAVHAAAGGEATAILCYSVLQYIFVDANPFSFLDSLMGLLAPGGSALIGDIPNISKRKRFFSSQTGVAFHKAFMKTEEPPAVRFNVTETGQIDDSVLMGMVLRARTAGCDAWL